MEFGAFTGCRSNSSRGSAVITATVDNPACDAITLHVTVEETQIPAVGDISISVAADSENNPISFSTQRSYIESVSMVEQATSGTARVSGTDSFTYFATNVIGDSNIGTATIEVTPFNNADLSALSLSEGTLSPSFDPNTLAYAAQVAPGTQAVTVTPTAEDSASTIDVNGETVDLGSVSPQVMLGQCGTDTAIEVDVTAQDNTTTNTYTITVARIGEISVVFDLGESGEPFDEQLVKCATTATEPEQPSLPGQVFTGWYLTDGSSGEPFDFDTPIFEELTLYAGWEVAPVAELALVIDASEVNQGETVTITARGLALDGHDLGDVTGGITLTSNVDSDEIDGNKVTFPTASEHIITATHADGAETSITVTVIPAAAAVEPAAPANPTAAAPKAATVGELVATGTGLGIGAVLGALVLLGTGAGVLWARRRLT